MMTLEEAIKELKEGRNNLYGVLDKSVPYEQQHTLVALDMAIRSLEAWGKVKKEIDDSILICQEYAQDDTWCDGELAGFLQSKDIIDRNLSEVSE